MLVSKKLNQEGFTHWIGLIIFIVVFGLIGYKVFMTHAQIITDTSDTQAHNEPKGMPIIDTSDDTVTAESAVNESTNAMNPSTTNHPGQPQCHYNFGACFYYVRARQKDFTATGASVVMSQAKPILGTKDVHTLIEMSVMKYVNTASNVAINDVIEVGWRVSKSFNDGKPRLFVFHWVNGNPTCFDGCGFVRNKASQIQVGDVLTTGTTGKFQINYKELTNPTRKQWQISHNGILLGYFPASIWNGTFTRIHSLQLFGEVEIPVSENYPHSEMGNGKYGSESGSAVFKNFSLINSNQPEQLKPLTSSDPHAYNRGNLNPTGMNFGGPGYW